MFYVNDVSLLEDEVTRYHYFLQLKLDVVEGRLRANCEQAIVLASYALQVATHWNKFSPFFSILKVEKRHRDASELIINLRSALIKK